ncbi:helix-turn-helix domain-containing protein [Saccharothrix deserti]|uniref:helix-turn-helix domain-containing protein n=1 Tax=Saccharothrix deserti TaxID=2593674 RepID=UPI00131CA133|nr:XRE family transcriptional regulator [Saccharothrix deserti]
MHEPLSIGPLLRRQRQVLGRSQSEQAEVLSELAGRAVTRNEVSRWESEARLLTPYWQQHYANSLSVPVAELRRAVAAAKAQRRLSRGEPRPEGGDVHRRAFLGTLAGLAASLPAVPLSAGGRRIGAAHTEQLLARTARLRRLDDFLGGADTYRLYAQELYQTSRLVRVAGMTSAQRQACTVVIAEQAQLAGWAAFDAGMHREAEEHYLTSLEAAKEAEDAALAGNALSFLAYQRVSVERPSVEMATASYATAQATATPRVRALLLERLAWTHAVAGQAQETERALAQADEALRVPSDRPEPDWVYWVDEDELQIMAGRCWTRLRRPLRAVPVLEGVLSRYSDTHARDKSMYLTSLAHAYVDAGEVEQAAVVTMRATELASGLGSVRPAVRIAEVAGRLRRHRSLPAVATTLDAADGLTARA